MEPRFALPAHDRIAWLECITAPSLYCIFTPPPVCLNHGRKGWRGPHSEPGSSRSPACPIEVLGAAAVRLNPNPRIINPDHIPCSSKAGRAHQSTARMTDRSFTYSDIPTCAAKNPEGFKVSHVSVDDPGVANGQLLRYSHDPHAAERLRSSSMKRTLDGHACQGMREQPGAGRAPPAAR